MKQLALASVVALAGCDSLFSLVHVPEPRGDALGQDGREPDATVDGRPDAKPCVPIGHNEDTDSIDDACDSCLSVPNSGIDADGDNIDDACDPDPASGLDTVLFATGFPDQGSFAQSFSTTGSVTVDPVTSKGQVTVFASATVTMQTPYTPTKIVLRTSGVGQGVGAQVDVQHSGATCIVMGSDCTKSASTLSCLVTGPGGGASDIATNSASIKLIELTGPTVQCHVAAGAFSSTLGTNATFTLDTLKLATSSTGSLVIDSIEIFGTQ